MQSPSRQTSTLTDKRITIATIGSGGTDCSTIIPKNCAIVRPRPLRGARRIEACPATPDESFILDDNDTIATVQQAHREACQSSRRATSSLGLDDILRGNRRGPLPLRRVYLHMLRELAQHCGHADILREQFLNE